MLSSGGMQDQRSRPLLCFQMSASQRFQLLHSATSTAGRSAQDSMNMVLCSTWTSTPVSSIYSKRRSTLPSSRDSCWSANLRPTCCWRFVQFVIGESREAKTAHLAVDHPELLAHAGFFAGLQRHRPILLLRLVHEIPSARALDDVSVGIDHRILIRAVHVCLR